MAEIKVSKDLREAMVNSCFRIAHKRNAVNSPYMVSVLWYNVNSRMFILYLAALLIRIN